MNTKESIEKAIREYRTLKADDERPALGREAYIPALAAHLAKVLPVTFDAVWNAVTYFGDCQNLDNYLRCNYNGSGSVISSRGTMLKWPASKTPGTSIIEAIKTAMKPEPTLNERALEALEYLQKAYGYGGEKLEIIREALEAKGCES